MDAKPDSPEEHRKSVPGDAPSSSQIGGPESFGVIELTRLKKDDGRALLVFSRPAER